MTIPKAWTHTSSNASCYNTATSTGVICVEGAIITPGIKLPTIYGSGTEFFNIQVSVYENPSHHTAKEWIENDLSEGLPSGQDITSTDSVNGYDTYYWKVINDSFHEMMYTFSTQKYVVFVYARTYEPGTSNGKPAGNFRQFESQITDMAKSVKIAA